ncbi:hypothetical protein EQV77_14875 [Halobacillus fulvus]|nr:hypothetical protein EQV77_14875 [Halobacillus fulvus]
MKNRKKRSYKETVKNTKFLEEILVKNRQMNEDYTAGPEQVNTEAGKRALSAFISQRDKQDQEDFYLYVAQEWVKNLDRKSIRTSILLVFVFLGLCLITIGLTQIVGDIGGTPALVILATIIFTPVIGVFNALRGKGWKKWLMVAVHALILYGFFLYILVNA